jgi:UDP-glucose 4-epimerase
MSGKILITGGLGNLGLWITDYLAKKGFSIYVLSTRQNLEGISIQKDFNLINGDIRNLELEILPKDIDYIIHLASFNEFFLPNYPKKALEINTFGTRNILEFAKNLKNLKRFIYFSTFHVYGAESGFINENSDLNPKNDYASTHLFAEYFVKQFGANFKIPFTIFRLTNSYGVPKDINSSKWYLVLNDLVKTAFETGKIVLKSNGGAKRDFISMYDVCRVVEKSLSFQENGVYNLGSGKTSSILELAQIVKDVYKNRYQRDLEIEINRDDLKDYGDLKIDISKISQKIDFQFSDRFVDEVQAIFNFLERRN